MTLVHVANGNTDVQHNVVLWPLQDMSFHYKFMQKKNTARAWEWWKWRSLPVKDWFWLADSPGADLFSTVVDILVLNSGIKHLGIRHPGIRHSGNDSQKHRFPIVQLEHNFAFQTATTHTISLAHKSLIEDCLCQSTIRKFVLYTYLSYWGSLKMKPSMLLRVHEWQRNVHLHTSYSGNHGDLPKPQFTLIFYRLLPKWALESANSWCYISEWC